MAGIRRLVVALVFVGAALGSSARAQYYYPPGYSRYGWGGWGGREIALLMEVMVTGAS